MFYIKSGHSNVPIKDPIYTTCPGVQVDLQDLLADGGDLTGRRYIAATAPPSGLDDTQPSRGQR